MTTIILISNITSIIVNIYTLWSVRKTLLNGAKNVAEEAKEIANKI